MSVRQGIRTYQFRMPGTRAVCEVTYGEPLTIGEACGLLKAGHRVCLRARLFEADYDDRLIPLDRDGLRALLDERPDDDDSTRLILDEKGRLILNL